MNQLNSLASTASASGEWLGRLRSGTRESETGLTFWAQWMVAQAVSLGVLVSLVLGKNGEVSEYYRVLMLMTLLASVPAYSLLQVYDKRKGYVSGLARLLAAWLLLLAALTVAGFVTKTSALFSREVMLQWAVLSYFAQVAAYLPLHLVARQLYAHQRAERTALVIGVGLLARRLADNLMLMRGEPVVGLVRAGEEEAEVGGGHRVIGDVGQLRRLIDVHGIRRLYIALPLTADLQIRELYIDLLDSHVDVVWVPDLQSMMLLNQSVSDIGGMPAIHLNESPLTAYPTAAFLKAVMDRLLALVAIVVLSPVLAATALAVRLSSSGPIFFLQERHGWNGKVFHMWKFRSMRLHADQTVKQATKGDPRVTAVGRFIRRTSIDELPQLFNVLKGDMSLVGPRPHAVAHNDYYTGKINAYMSRHRVKPGITGLAQISGCRGETETLDKMAKRVELDLVYINNWSLLLDLKILVKTPFTLLSKEIY